MEQKIRWGILGTGSIAKQFAEALRVLPQAQLHAVGSRSAETAKAFAEAFGVRHAYDSYQQLVENDDVDVVYVATPHPLHLENTLMSLRAGRAVLCEKPLAINAIQAEKMIAMAVEKKLFLMEAMWTRFLPVFVKVRQWLKEGLIGEVNLLQADFGFSADWTDQSRILNPQLGGGALLDVGIYPLSLASMIFAAEPTNIASGAHLGKTGVDELSAFVLNYSSGQMAVLTCAVKTDTARQAIIYGTKGSIRIPSFFNATQATLSLAGEQPRTIDIPHKANGLEYEAIEVMRAIRAGDTQSKVMPLDESLSIMKTMDRIRSQWGLKYPME